MTEKNAQSEAGLASDLNRELDAAEKDNFAVSISDGYCEWTYKLTLSDKLSIAKIAEKLCDAFGVEVPEPTFRS
jgi:hypothetical protein